MSETRTRPVPRPSGGHLCDAIVLCRAVTGLATVRALAAQGVRVHALLLDANDPLRGSRHGIKTDLSDIASDSEKVVSALRAYAQRLGARPVVIPTSDPLALLLAANQARLNEVCRVWTTDPSTLQAIVCKEHLYASAEVAGVATIPCVSEASYAAVADWSDLHAGPYFLKPSYEAIADSSVRGKNFVVQTRAQLLAFVSERGLRNAVVQRYIQGGDGEIYDSYGLCDHNGRVVVMASHRRLRQYPPNTGATCYGAIPSGLPDDDVLFEPTRRLLGQWRYHGIFGIEWLRDRETGEFYLIDFNARPFSSIGHLADGGLNLPWLAWRELQGDALADVPELPTLSPSLWIDALRDIASWRRMKRGSVLRWLNQWRMADHHAFWRRDDPGPARLQGVRFASVVAGVAARRLRESLPGYRLPPEAAPIRRLEDRSPPLV